MRSLVEVKFMGASVPTLSHKIMMHFRLESQLIELAAILSKNSAA
jgi:hypothetical protein